MTNEEPRRGARLDAGPQSRRGREGALFALVTLSLFAQALGAQTFPNRPLRLLTGGAGGGNDIAARLIADGLTANLGQQVFVDNRPSGFVPGETVAKAKPDGYTLVLSGRSHWMAPLTVDKAPYDPTKDFAAITLPATTPNVLAVHPSLPVKSVKDLIALARARPGELNYGAAGQGSGPHLAGALFNQMAGVNIVRVNYRAMGAVYTDLMAGQVHIAFGSAPGVMPLVESGRLRGLAVSSGKPSALAPGLPTIAASGVAGYDFTSPFGIFAPAETPPALVARLNEEILRVLGKPEVKERFIRAGMETVGSTPDELTALVRTEMQTLANIVREQGR